MKSKRAISTRFGLNYRSADYSGLEIGFHPLTLFRLPRAGDTILRIDKGELSWPSPGSARAAEEPGSLEVMNRGLRQAYGAPPFSTENKTAEEVAAALAPPDAEKPARGQGPRKTIKSRRARHDAPPRT